MAERRGRLDTPTEQRRPLIRTPSYDRDAFGVFAFAEFAAAAVFLASEPAAYISGVTLLVDGGAFRGTY